VYIQSNNDSYEDLAKCGYKLKYESRIFQISFNIFGYILESCKKIWQNFLIFFQLLAIENLKKNLILAGAIFNIAFWLYIYI
jgi:hypothetical protein